MTLLVKVLLTGCLVALLSLVSLIINSGRNTTLDTAAATLGLTSFTTAFVSLIALIWAAT